MEFITSAEVSIYSNLVLSVQQVIATENLFDHLSTHFRLTFITVRVRLWKNSLEFLFYLFISKQKHSFELRYNYIVFLPHSSPLYSSHVPPAVSEIPGSSFSFNHYCNIYIEMNQLINTTYCVHSVLPE